MIVANRKKLYRLMALKQNVELLGHARSASALHKEILRNSEIQEKLELISSSKRQKKIKTGMELRSENWYDNQVQSQLTEMKNRQKFLSEEAIIIKRRVAQSHQKLKQSKEKVAYYRREQLIEKEKKFESSIPPKPIIK